MSRPSKYTPELVAQILGLIDAGVFVVDACMAVGIHEDTYYHWLRTKPEFSEFIKKRKEKAIATRAARIEHVGGWKANILYYPRSKINCN